MPDYWSSIWDTLWWAITAFAFLAYLMALFSIISDLFRDREMGGAKKAVWLVFLVFLPFLTALVYLVLRGAGMAARAARQEQLVKAAADDYIRSVAGGPATEIAQAQALLDAGAITADEFERLKAGVLKDLR
ncbi:MAG: SHOCT domain-containing protein [Nocardioides sp.]|uniref:SHOCT domain-containing protein n=1 Tax=Nocardioides sp. TaxID=35761 RepID=UPI003F0530F4